MSKEIIIQRRKLHKRRFLSSLIQLSVILGITLYNCIAELFFPSIVLPVSFYIPQFLASLARRNILESKELSFACLLTVTVAVLAFLTVCLALSRRSYPLITCLTVVSSIDVVLLIYIALQSFVSKGFEPFFIINLAVHVWMLVLSVTMRRSSEGLDVLPENPEDLDKDEL